MTFSFQGFGKFPHSLSGQLCLTLQILSSLGHIYMVYGNTALTYDVTSTLHPTTAHRKSMLL